MIEIRVKANDLGKLVISGDFPESSYESYVVMDIVGWNTSHGVIYDTPTVVSDDNDVELPLTHDGWFTVTRVSIPTKDGYESYEQENSDVTYSVIYYIDDDSIYKNVSGKIFPVDFTELAEINPANTTLDKGVAHGVSTWFMKNECLERAEELLDKYKFPNCSSDHTESLENDLKFIILNIMKYLSKSGDFLEAQKAYEFLTPVCAQYTLSSSCNCNKKWI